MKIHVVTPIGPGTKRDHLLQCVDSLAAQTWTGRDKFLAHTLVFDGAKESEFVDLTRLWSANVMGGGVIELPRSANDIGSTPRTVGAAYAWGQGADAVAFLDADCWYLPDHIERLVSYHEKTGKPVVCCGRWITDETGTEMERCPEIDPRADPPFHDTNTFLFTRGAIGLSYVYGTLTGREEHKVGDRILTQRALPHLACHYHPTVVYRSVHRFHYERFGWDVPDGMKLKDLRMPG